MNALIFIDTNIFLDFYRIRNSEVSMSYLKLINEHHDSIITGSQVEMEYKKNRQSVIVESQGKFKNPDWNNLSVPALLSEESEALRLQELRKEVASQQAAIKNKIDKILSSPVENDPVYKSLESLFRNSSANNLSREHTERQKFRELAIKRFMLGYPPRKKNDTSVGDAINWEWIINCARQSNKNIFIVSRDGDYGVNLRSGSFINDWLSQEFKQRTSEKLEILLTTRLSEAFKRLNVAVTKDMIDEETRVLDEYDTAEFEDTEDNVTNKIFDILKRYK